MDSTSRPPAPQPPAPGPPTEPPIRKTPFVAYTVVVVATVYLLAAPTSLRDFLLATLVAGLLTLIGGMAWLAAH